MSSNDLLKELNFDCELLPIQDFILKIKSFNSNKFEDVKEIKNEINKVYKDLLEIIYILNWDVQNNTAAVQKQLFIELEAQEQLVYDFLQDAGRQQLDHIALNCKMPTYKAAGILLEMELKGAIRPLPGKLFEVI
jgi:DNA processing protein